MRVVNIGNIADAYICDDLPAMGIVIEATLDELERLPNLTYKEVTISATPRRNCDRPECATTKAAQDVWRKEDGGKTAYYEWLLATANAAVSIIGRESINKQCYECANCKEPTAGWDGSKFRCAFLGKDFDTWHYDVPNECPCKGNGWAPKEKEGDDK